MARQDMPKMSLVAQYDDLCRYTKVLTAGCEEEFKSFVQSQLDLLRQLKAKEAEIKRLNDRLSSIDSERMKYERQIENLKFILENEKLQKEAFKRERDSMKGQIAIIKDVLMDDCNMDQQTRVKLAFLNQNLPNSPPRLTTIEESGSAGSVLSPSDEDLTGNLLDSADIDERPSNSRKRRSKGKRKSSGNRTSPKRPKADTRTETETDVDSDLPEIRNYPYKPLLGGRSNSEPVAKTPDVPTLRVTHRSDSDQFKFNTYDLRRSNTGTLSSGTPVGRYSTGGMSRKHNFVSKTVIRTEKCVPCGSLIKFCKQALKCQDCRVICHPDCKDKCPPPCIPTVNTPTKGSEGTIADYTSTTPPMIPALIVHCINEIQSRGFKEIGLYRISGSDREVKELKEKLLRGRTFPCLNQVDVHAICGTIKEFLRSLKEPLIPRSFWKTMVEAAEIEDEKMSMNVLFETVMEFPQPNRDTLAFLILHLQRVAESPYCKMPIENLAKIFGPTIVGYSTAEPSNVLGEVPLQHQVMQRLLLIHSDSWENLLNVEKDVFFTPSQKTPETLPAPKATRLGPYYSAQKSKNFTVSRTPLTPRHTKSNKTSGRMQFSSPYLK